MFNINIKDANRLDIEIKGKIDAEEMASALDDLIEQSEGMIGGKMLYRIEDLHLPSFRALGVELTKIPSLLKLIGRFDRVALVADKAWLRVAGEIEGALFPGMKIKGFEPAELTEAEAWLTG
ncbi:MAG: STAS/SEC14 domain-containing protein [Gammaproteobacteria bacterium]|nr:STAS/SEC14 domain-containing protein [Gammaproteobacteria bacterium]